jgi:hypothetical protein
MAERYRPPTLNDSELCAAIDYFIDHRDDAPTFCDWAMTVHADELAGMLESKTSAVREICPEPEHLHEFAWHELPKLSATEIGQALHFLTRATYGVHGYWLGRMFDELLHAVTNEIISRLTTSEGITHARIA